MLRRELLADLAVPPIPARFARSFPRTGGPGAHLGRHPFNEHSVRVAFEERSMLTGELAEVFLCPLKLHPGTAQGIAHDKSIP